jgi:hypothetical protein
MGCDIHGYVEERSGDSWWLFSGRLSLGRDYRMFGLLAGVREGGPPIVAPRGFPLDASYGLKDEFHLHVTESACGWGGCRVTTLKNADAWVKQGLSRYVTDDARSVTDPDWHTPSWLTLEELLWAISKYEGVAGERLSQGWLAVAGMMRHLPGSRFVFWFDN